MKALNYIVSAIVGLSSLSANAQGLVLRFQSGDKVAFVGDSITHGGHYHSYIWLFYMTRFPDMPLWFYNCGVGGDTSKEILNRLQDDVLSRNPDYITLTFGMNDTGYSDVFNRSGSDSLSAARIEKSKRDYLGIVDLLKIDSQPLREYSSDDLEKGINLAELTASPQYRQASAIMYLNEERLEIDKRLREYVWMEYNVFKDPGKRFVDDWESIETVSRRAREDWFVAASNYWYRKSYYPEIREIWEKYMQELVELIYRMNKPLVRVISLERTD